MGTAPPCKHITTRNFFSFYVIQSHFFDSQQEKMLMNGFKQFSIKIHSLFTNISKKLNAPLADDSLSFLYVVCVFLILRKNRLRHLEHDLAKVSSVGFHEIAQWCSKRHLMGELQFWYSKHHSSHARWKLWKIQAAFALFWLNWGDFTVIPSNDSIHLLEFMRNYVTVMLLLLSVRCFCCTLILNF